MGIARNRAACGCLGLIASLALIPPALAADIHVISTDNVMPAFSEIQPTFEGHSGHKLTFQHQGSKPTMKLVESGAQGDVVINSRPVLDALLAEGKIKPGSIVNITHSSLGVVVLAGGPKPDISTDEKFKQFLLDAKTLVYPDPAKGSLGGNYFAALIKTWGIADQVNAKAQLVAGGDPTGHVVADGKAQFGINQIAEISSVPGLEFLTPLPPVLTNKVIMAAAILANAKQPDAGASWISFIASPAAAAAIKAHGMVPYSE